MEKGKQEDSSTQVFTDIEILVFPGICGFECSILARKALGYTTIIEINSDCEKIQKLGHDLVSIGLREVLAPFSKNPVYIAAEKAKCHASCPVPSAIIKVCEVALDIALPRDVKFNFKK